MFQPPIFFFFGLSKKKKMRRWAVETTEAPPVADEARLFRGSGTIGGHEMSGNRYAATVFEEKEIASGACRRIGTAH
ncbi:MAG: hypothetical protein IKC24_04000 [Oscillospiraceae bacterium]|nr:hypothetical protein [Oscillospiraceae bacterium]